MKEARYQARIMAQIKQDGGVAVNGQFSTAGEADLQCGIPIEVLIDSIRQLDFEVKTILIHVAVEVKTEFDYHRVMSGIDADYNVIDKAKLKKHEVLQMAKIRRNRKLGGLALVAYNYKQVLEYVNG